MTDDLKIEGYASLFWTRDLNDDVTAAGAFAGSLAETGVAGVKMLHQHDDAEPIGVWDEIVEDARGPVRPRPHPARDAARPPGRRPGRGRGVGRAVDRLSPGQGAGRRGACAC
jgi:hypothetical protein